MGRTSKKYKHNAKTLRKYKVKELRNFIKENKLPIKRTSKLTKTEIVGSLLKLQRNGHCKCFNGLAIREKKKLTPLQQQALLKGQNAMRERRRKMKEQVKPEQKIDEKPINVSKALKISKVPVKKVPVTKEIIEEITDEIKKELNEPTQLEKLKFEGGNEETRLYQEILNIEDLIEKADKDYEKDLKYFEELLKELQEQEEEISKEDEEIYKMEISMLTIPELKKVLDENNISRRGITLKSQLVNLVYNNRNYINDLPEIIDQKKESKKRR